MLKDKIINLPSKGRLIVVTDLHGNFTDYEKYVKIWNSSKNSHIVFLGDLIHSSDYDDQSIEILDDVISKQDNPTFHVLLGNHEWAHITKTDLYKFNKNQRTQFEEMIKTKKGALMPTLEEYVDYFKSLPFFMKTENGLFLSHTGPSKNIKSIDDFNKISDEDYNNGILYDFLWNRFIVDYNKSDISRFLSIIESNCMIIGHTPINSHKIYGQQVILSSSFNTVTKAYFDIDLTMKIEKMEDLMKYLKVLD